MTRNDQKIWVTSDLHFGHKALLKNGFRSFNTIEAMDKALIKNWNDVVDKDDLVYVLGDFSYYSRDVNMRIFADLKGTKCLIKGNHDDVQTTCLPWKKISNYQELYKLGKFIVMCHFPFKEWNGRKQGSVHLHGHIHSNVSYHSALANTEKYKRRVDVGVDGNAFAPVNLSDVIQLVKQRDRENKTLTNTCGGGGGVNYTM